MAFGRWFIGLLLVLATSAAIAADGDWKLATTPHYRLLSQASERETTAWMRGFDQFILSTSDVLKTDLRSLPPLTIVLFDRDRDYAPYKLQRPDGRTAAISGQFIRWPTLSMMGMAHAGNSEELRRTIQHEATHWLMSGSQRRQPAWFAEGIAELFSTFERRGDKVNWAKPIEAHLILLNTTASMPLNELLVQPSAIFNRDDHTDRFYAQAWAFTHFLMASNRPDRRQLLNEFLQQYQKQSGEATVQAVFGPKLKDIERDFRAYIAQRSFLYMIDPVKPATAPPPLRPAPPALVEASLGLLALGAKRQELAKQHALKSIELDSEAFDGHAVLAYIALETRDFDEAAVHAEAALARGSKDSDLFMVMGDSYIDGRNSRKPDAKQLRVDMYEKAINLNPRRLAVYHQLVEALLMLDKPREEDAKFLNVGLQVFPGEDWLRVGIAFVDYRHGRRDVAMATLEETLRPESTLDGLQRTNATNLRRNWLAEAMNAEIEVVVRKRDFTEARAIVSRYRELIGAGSEMDPFIDELDRRLEMGELMIRFEQALLGRKVAEARALGEQLLARPELPRQLRSYVEDGLRRIK